MTGAANDDGEDGAGQGRRGRRLLWAGGIAVCLALALALGVRAGLPGFVERAAERGLAGALDVPVDITEVRLDLRTGGFALGEARAGEDPEKPVARWQRLTGRIDLDALWARRVRFPELEVEGLRLQLVRTRSGRLQLRGARPNPTAAGAAAPPVAVDALRLRDAAVTVAGAGTPPLELAVDALLLTQIGVGADGFELGAVSLQGPHLHLPRDLALGPELAAPPAEPAPSAEAPTAGPLLRQISVERGGITLVTPAGAFDVSVSVDAREVGMDAPFPLRVALAVGPGRLELEGEGGLAPPSFRGRVVWHDLPLPVLSMVARSDLASWMAACRASGRLAVRASLGDVASRGLRAGVRVDGRLAADDLVLADPRTGEPVLSWRHLEAEVLDGFVPLSASAPARLALGRVLLVDPTSAIGGTAAAWGTADAAAERVAPGLEVTLAALAVRGGRLALHDPGASPAYTGQVTELAIEAGDLAWPAPRAARLHATGRLDGAAFAADGRFDEGRGALTLEVERLPLVPLEGYVVHTTGYRPLHGAASLHAEVLVEDARVDLDSDLVLHDLRVERVGESPLDRSLGMPMAVALTLIRDREGDVRLDVPLRFDRDGSRGPGTVNLLRQAVVQALRGAVTSPLQLVGSLLPDVRPGRDRSGDRSADRSGDRSADRSASSMESALEATHAGRIAELLAAKPELGVLLRGEPQAVERTRERLRTAGVGAERVRAEIDPGARGLEAGFFLLGGGR